MAVAPLPLPGEAVGIELDFTNTMIVGSRIGLLQAGRFDDRIGAPLGWPDEWTEGWVSAPSEKSCVFSLSKILAETGFSPAKRRNLALGGTLVSVKCDMQVDGDDWSASQTGYANLANKEVERAFLRATVEWTLTTPDGNVAWTRKISGEAAYKGAHHPAHDDDLLLEPRREADVRPRVHPEPLRPAPRTLQERG